MNSVKVSFYCSALQSQKYLLTTQLSRYYLLALHGNRLHLAIIDPMSFICDNTIHLANASLMLAHRL